MALPKSWSEFASRLTEFAKEKSEWSGLPVPVKGLKLRLADSHPYKHLEDFRFPEEGTSVHVDTTETCNEDLVYHEVNRFWSSVKGADIIVIRKANGRTTYGVQTYNRAKMWLATLDASFVWPLEAEQKALEKLLELIGHHKWRMYALTGCFMETSPRSGVTYMFRKLKPTLAIKAGPTGELRILCGLCLHPVGFYEGSHAGVMVPTDDVIAHLCLMRGDEQRLWRQANQHAAYRPECGL